MDVGVHHGLPGCSTIIHADIESSGMELFNQSCPDLGSQLPKGCLFVGIQVEQADDMLLGDDQGMAFGHGKGIQQGNAHLVFQQDFVGFQIAEGAGHAGQCTKSDQMAKARPHLLLGDLG